MTATLLSIVGARPNFMKLAPIARVLERRSGVRHLIVHTGQHYDDGMSATFLRDLEIPTPHKNLGVGSGSHARQTADAMVRLESVLLADRPDWVLVYGDVNSTLAAAIVAAKIGIPVAHVEAGLRSRDRTMPEEINRVVTDHLSQILFTTSRDANANLAEEGIGANAVHFVGNVMADEVLRVLPHAVRRNLPAKYGVEEGRYVVATFHRAGQVDRPDTLGEIVAGLSRIATEAPVLFPLHPRTKARLEVAGLATATTGVRLLEPLGYTDMIGLVARAGVIVTDSGGLQAEASVLGVPCVTARANTEWLVTLSQGTNRLVPPLADAIHTGVMRALEGERRRSGALERWDGRTADRIVGVLLDSEEYR